MTELLFPDDGSSVGYRLDKLEVHNWGTFDSTGGTVHVVRPTGATSLLIGQNGCGKSTLVDALLTLLVRSGVRNYNVAAGAQKSERDERSYVKGAYDRRSREEDNRAEVKYLRPDPGALSALLATFRNGRGEVFTVAQVLYVATDGGVQKVFCFALEEKSIREDLSGLLVADRLRRQLQERGFRATEKYAEYHGWIARLTGMRPKAMDIFNQTVAVKDIQSLNRFIREHMLEAKPWAEKVEALQAHFAALTEAHRNLVRVRKQFEMLGPIAAKGEEYRQREADLEAAQSLVAASASFFEQWSVDVLEPEHEAAEGRLSAAARRIEELDRDLEERREEERRLRNELDSAGGDRLRQIPGELRVQEVQLEARVGARKVLHDALRTVGIAKVPEDESSFVALRDRVPAELAALQRRLNALREKEHEAVLERGEVRERMKAAGAELEALGKRPTKLPEQQMELRRELCAALGQSERDLPFAAELIQVRPEERDWEASAEMVLRSFALSLLVPERLYRLVSAHVNRVRLRDGRGRGQRLVYLRVGEQVMADGMRGDPSPTLLPNKLQVKDGHPLRPWVVAELRRRFDYLCCETIEQFQGARGHAVTRERHMKMGAVRHEKDDRDRVMDPSNFVLGWDNREKRRHLTEMIERLRLAADAAQSTLAEIEREQGREEIARAAYRRILESETFAAVDPSPHQRAIAALREEKRALENDNDAVRTLHRRIAETARELERLTSARDGAVGARGRAERDLKAARDRLTDARRLLADFERDGSLERHKEHFGALGAKFVGYDLRPEVALAGVDPFRQPLQADADKLRNELEPLRSELTRLMGHYLREFKEEQADLDAGPEYLSSFLELYERICRDDLPRHEARFKQSLNEKVTHEIGILNAAFQAEKEGIEHKVEQLNTALRKLEYHPGTYMRLEPRAVRDLEIQDFQHRLRECLADTFEGTLEADEARFVRIESLLTRLRDEERWRDRVTDVRRWFDFVAREVEAATGEERSYYEDSTGQSGGEKAKLAFTILVAAIAYQYDIDPESPSTNRFQFVMVDEMFSKVDDAYSEYALKLFRQFGLQLLIVAPLDAKARVTEPFVGCYMHVVKDPVTHRSEIFSMTAVEFTEAALASDDGEVKGKTSGDGL